MSSVGSTGLEGTARDWAGVWGLLCLGLCSTSGCLGACHSGPFMAFLGSAEAPSWAVSTVQGTGAGKRFRFGSLHLENISLQACLRCSGRGLWEMALRSLLPLSLQDLQPPIPDGPSSCPCPFQISCQPAGGAPSHRGRASHAQDAQQRAKSSEVERGHLFLDLTVFFQELIFLLDFLRVSSFCPSILKLLKILCPPPHLFWSFDSGPQNHTPKFCARLTPRLPTRPVLTPSLITVPGSPHAPNGQCHPGRAEPCLLLR